MSFSLESNNGTKWSHMLAFTFDDTFEGLLTAVFNAYTEKIFPDLVLGGRDTPPLAVSETRPVVTNRAKADRVFAGLARRLSRPGKNTLLLSFLSEEQGAASLLFRYIRKVFDSHVPVEGDYADPDILATDRLAKKVYAEARHLEGFARFQKTAEGIYVSALGPRHNVLSLLLPHFKSRFACMRWIIYDTKRGYGFLHENGAIADVYLDPSLVGKNGLDPSLLAEDEALLQTMWRDYFFTAAVMERVNPKLQARCLPRRFWPYLTEMREQEPANIFAGRRP